MSKNLTKAFFILRNLSLFKRFLNFYWEGYLFDIGWVRSFEQQRSLGKNNEPLPWVTYSFIEFVRTRLKKQMIMLEYGSGNSTLFYSQFVSKVYAVEHDAEWVQELTSKLPSNVLLMHKPLDYGGVYAAAAHDTNEKFDVIIVDGRDRVNCIRQSIANLSDDGVMVLDDSERDEYKEGVSFLEQRDFRRIDFWGIAPGVFFNKCTSVFYRGKNCFNI
jgi:hypothetical protein